MLNRLFDKVNEKLDETLDKMKEGEKEGKCYVLKFLKAGGVAMAAFIAVNVAASAAYVLGTKDEALITVKDKETKVRPSSSHSDGAEVEDVYMVFGTQEVFENTDSLLRAKFNSSDVQGQLDRGATYKCDVYGWRVPVLSMYRNIVSCEEVKPAELKLP